MNLIDMDRLRKELTAKGDIPIHEVFNTIWDQPIVNICEVEEQQPCEDCISRKEALRHRHIIYDDDGVGYSVVRVDEIEQLPFVTPKPCEEENPTCTECRYYDKEKHHCPRFCRVIEDTMAEITSNQTKWIPISEKPQEGTYLITGQYGKNRYVDIATFDGEDATDIMSWDSYSDEYKVNKHEHKVIAWMPLPEPYEAESEDKK